MGLFIFKTLLVGTFLSSDMRNLSVCSKGGSNLPLLFLLGLPGRDLGVESERGLLRFVARLKRLSSFKSSLFNEIRTKVKHRGLAREYI